MDSPQAIADAVFNRLRPMLDRVQPDARLLSVKQAAVYLGRSTRGLRALIASGGIPSVRADTRVMLDRQDLDRWIEQNKA